MPSTRHTRSLKKIRTACVRAASCARCCGGCSGTAWRVRQPVSSPARIGPLALVSL